MKPTLLIALLCTALVACSAESTGPAEPIGAPEPTLGAAAAPAENDAIQDAMDRIAASLEGPGAGRLRGALLKVLNTDNDGRDAAVEAAWDAIDAMEQEAGATVGAELDAIRLALPAR